MPSRKYVARQIAALLAFAKSTSDPTLFAVLVDRAADMKSRFDEVPADPDVSPLAPDVDQDD